MKIHLHITLSSALGSPKRFLSLRFPHQTPVYTSPLPHKRYMSRPFHSSRYYHSNSTGRFIMFSVITNIYNKKTKEPTLMELFTATGKLEKFFFFISRDVRCLLHGWHGTHRYDIQVLATHASTSVHRYSSLLQWSVPLFIPRTNDLVCWRVLCTKCTLHSNHRLTRVIFQHTKLLSRSGHFITT
jgi:hypothetical protein